jgi:hypothetical protein
LGDTRESLAHTTLFELWDKIWIIQITKANT